MSDPTPMTRPEREYYRQVADRIRAARSRRQISQVRLGARIGVTGTAISYWENAIHAPTLWRVKQLERALGEELIP